RMLIADHQRGATLAGLCLGALALVDAELPRAQSAVTRWHAPDLLRHPHSDIPHDDSVLYIEHARVPTSAGTASGLDACLHLVRSRLGADTANQVARSLVIAPHRECGQAQYIERPVPQEPGDGTIPRVLEWASEHLQESLTIERLAA